MLSDRQISSYAKPTVKSRYIHLNQHRASELTLGYYSQTTCGNHLLVLSLVKSNPPPSKWVGLGSPLAACSVYGDLTRSVHTVNNLCMFSCQCHFYLCNRGPYVSLAILPNMSSFWHKDIIIIIPPHPPPLGLNIDGCKNHRSIYNIYFLTCYKTVFPQDCNKKGNTAATYARKVKQ